MFGLDDRAGVLAGFIASEENQRRAFSVKRSNMIRLGDESMSIAHFRQWGGSGTPVVNYYRGATTLSKQKAVLLGWGEDAAPPLF